MDTPEQQQPAPPPIRETRICDLGLALEGSDVERFVQQLHRDLEQKKITKFKPAC